jgi:hypothetical protein
MHEITMDDRRSLGRTRIAKAALLFFGGQTGVRSCGVTDITNAGAGIHTQGLAVLPLNFELSFDNFRTIRKCRLIWRDGNFLGVVFENQNARTHSETKASEAGGAIPAFPASNDPPQPTHRDNASGSSEHTSEARDRKITRQSDIRFTIGVAIALALPALIGMSVYVATTTILRAS